MSGNFSRVRFGVAFAAGALFAASTANAATYLIIGAKKLPANLSAQVEAAGGILESSYPFAVAVASSDNPDFAGAISGVRSIIEDTGFTTETPITVAADVGNPPNSGDDDAFFDLQWGHNYVRAQYAWDAGVTGQGVRVAVLDGGFDLDHPDIAPNLNLALSADFTGEGLQYGPPDPFSHGTHVAGTILAADNGIGTIGVAPDAELVAVKVLSDAGSGSFEDILAGIYHAADVDADVINMSLGTIIPRTADPRGVTELAVAVQHAINYATQQGTTVVVSGGNAATDLDGDADNVRFMTGVRKTIGVSALTTLNWASDPDNAILYPASYTNYGTSMIDFGAPGGGVDYPGNEGCVVAGLARPCWVFDLIFSTGNGGWYWSAGTSMAAPHVAGLAALIISENGGDMTPAQVAAALRHRAEDLFKPGADDYSGRGLPTSGY